MGFISDAMSQLKHGKRLIPHVVDELARTNPDHVFAMVPKTSNLADGFQEITIKSFARAVDEIAHRVESATGKSTKFDTIAYIGPSQSSLGVAQRINTDTDSGPAVLRDSFGCCEGRLQG